MNDLLRAWNLLGEDERPEGMEWLAWEGTTHPFIAYNECYGEKQRVSDRAAYDRLTLALERKLLREGWVLVWNFRMYCWHHDKCKDDYQHPDQLTAACLAAESMGGGE